jgi:hypothetical protein
VFQASSLYRSSRSSLIGRLTATPQAAATRSKDALVAAALYSVARTVAETAHPPRSRGDPAARQRGGAFRHRRGRFAAGEALFPDTGTLDVEPFLCP